MWTKKIGFQKSVLHRFHGFNHFPRHLSKFNQKSLVIWLIFQDCKTIDDYCLDCDLWRQSLCYLYPFVDSANIRLLIGTRNAVRRVSWVIDANWEDSLLYSILRFKLNRNKIEFIACTIASLRRLSNRFQLSAISLLIFCIQISIRMCVEQCGNEGNIVGPSTRTELMTIKCFMAIN